MSGTTSRRIRARGRTVVQLLALVGLVAGTLVVLPSVSGGATNTFSNTSPILLYRPPAPPGCPSFPSPNNSCPPTPPTLYPSPITVAGMGGTVTDVNVTLHALDYNWWDGSDLDVMLVAPNGSRIMLMSDACGDSVNNDGIPITSPIDLTFDDEALAGMPLDTVCLSGTYLPTDEDEPAENFPFTADDVFCGPPSINPELCQPPTAAEASPTSTDLNTFTGIDPNGTWKLYVVDDTPSDPGSDLDGFNGGWSLTITDNAVATTTTTEATTTTSTSTTTTSTSTTTTSTSTTTTSTSTTTTTVPVVEADLRVTISAADSIRAGRRTTVSTMVRNLGPSTATNVTVTLDLDDDFVVSRYSPSSCTLGAGNVLTCTYASLASGGKVSVKATGSYPATAAGPNTNTASASSDTTDPVAGNNSASKTTGVVA